MANVDTTIDQALPEFTRGTLPDPRSWRNRMIVIVENNGSRRQYFSDGKVWTSGDGSATNFEALTDATDAPLHEINIPLANALSEKATLQASATLVASAVEAPRADAVAAAIALAKAAAKSETKAELIGTAPATLDTIQEISAAFNNNPDIINAMATTVAVAQDTADLAQLAAEDAVALASSKVSPSDLKTIGGVSALGVGNIPVLTSLAAAPDVGSANLPLLNGPTATALNAKADLLGSAINIASGATITIDQINHVFNWIGTVSGSIPLPALGSDLDFAAFRNPVTNADGVVLTITGCTVPTGKRATVKPGETAYFMREGSVWVATADAPAAGGGVDFSGFANITPTTGVAGTTSYVINFPAGGNWSGPIQWRRNTGSGWSDISGATFSVYDSVSPADNGADLDAFIGASGGLRFLTSSVHASAPGVAAPVFTAQSAPGGTVGSSTPYTFVATGATSYAVASGALPAGRSLNTATGEITGTFTTAASYTFVISATNAGGTTNSTSQTVVVAAGNTMVRSPVAAADENFSTNGSDDWWYCQDGAQTQHKVTGTAIAGDGPVFVNMALQAWGSTGPTTITVVTPDSEASKTSNVQCGVDNIGAGDATATFTVTPAGAGTHRMRFFGGGGDDPLILTATGVGGVTATRSIPGNTKETNDFVFTTSAPGQSVTLEAKMTTENYCTMQGFEYFEVA